MGDKSKLRSLLLEISQNVPFYKSYFDSNKDKNPELLGDYPILTKKDICTNPDAFLNKRYSRENLLLKKTSGSTGIPLNVYKSQNDLFTQLKILWKFRKAEFNISPTSKYIVFYLSRYSFKNINQRFNYVNENTLAINIVNISAKEFLNLSKIIGNFQPDFIMGTPTSVCDLIYAYNKYNCFPPSSIKYVELMSEYLFSSQYDMIKEVLRCPISNHYGCTEVLGIAQQKNGSKDLTIFDENVFLENFEDKLLVTGLNSIAMPFVRYDIGDLGIINQKKKSIELKAGRSNDLIFLDKINREHSATLCKIIDGINSRVNQITRFKFYQKSFALFDVYLSIRDSSLQKTVVYNFEEEVSKYAMFNNCNWDIHFISFDEFYTLQEKNKFSYFVNEIQE